MTIFHHLVKWKQVKNRLLKYSRLTAVRKTSLTTEYRSKIILKNKLLNS